MLVLKRRVGEVILIGPDVVVSVEEIDARSGYVRLGVRAPREVPVNRPEWLAKKQAAETAGGPPCNA